jgi:hypothetical protein
MKINLLILSFFFLFSCSKKEDDKNDTSAVDPLVGKWKYVYYKFNDTSGKTVSEGGVIGCEADWYFEFRKDGTFTFYESRLNETTKECDITTNDLNTWKRATDELVTLSIKGNYSFYVKDFTYNTVIKLNENKTQFFYIYDSYKDGKLVGKGDVLTFSKQ